MKLIVFKEKYDNRYFLYNTDEEKYLIFVKIAKERLNLYYSDNDLEEITNLLDKFNSSDKMTYSKSIYKWMKKRSTYEYESFEEISIENIN